MASSISAAAAESDICHICMASEGDSFLKPLHDGIHLFHESCVNPWLDIKGTCPLCRKQVCEIRVNEASPEAQAVIAAFNSIFGNRFSPVSEPVEAPPANINELAAIVDAGNAVAFEAWLSANPLQSDIYHQSLRSAAASIDSSFLTRLINLNPFSIEIRGELLNLAAERGLEENVGLILASGPISGIAKTQACQKAEARGFIALSALIFD